MSKRSSIRALAIGAVALVVGFLAVAAAARLMAEELKAGDEAPDFSLEGSDGKTYKLSDYRGKQAVVIAWFPKAFTSGCTAECKSLKENGAAVRKFDVAYFTASCDPAETNKRFAESLELDYPILSDPTRTTAEAYGVVDAVRRWPQRWTFYIGEDGKILYIDKKVKTGSHAEDIAAKLKELGVKEREETKKGEGKEEPKKES